ncbi:protein ECERIFERUM 2-like [Neltuma alba]|uniref:protein ECERIFERUM 2-like n=1 Tax=Neltuma alba TaxID=207710 RepID=UPI0010A2B066|nr:protein ECERIFERUM 2-like [Prosopis alba]
MGIMGAAKPRIEAVLTVSPLKVTEPRQVRQVQAAHNPKAISGCHHIVLYFTKSRKDDDDGEPFLAGWAVESLAMVLSEHPLVAGRLRRREDGGEEDDSRALEIVSNDSGIRMVEARIPMSMSQLLGLNREDFVGVEADLVFWKDVDEHTPDFSPLFYIQVTNFECGGYSIGISCSLLLAEFLIVENFLKKWSDIHKNHVNLKSQNEEDSTKTVTPIFYHPRLKNPESPPPDIIARTPTKNQVVNLMFKVTSQDAGFDEDDEEQKWKELGMICVKKAEQKLERNMASESFWLMVMKCGEVIREVGSCRKRSTSSSAGLMKKKEEVVWATWDEFGEYEVEFEEGNKAVFVSRWINGSVCDDDEAQVVAVPCPKVGVSALIMVSLPV